jgi:hypothetical protein
MDGQKGNRPGRGRKRGAAETSGLQLRVVQGTECELVYPRCVHERREDYEEAIEAWRAGAIDEALDILRFALEGCGTHAWIHVALGQIALQESGDLRLARGHFGYVIELAQPLLKGRSDVWLSRNRPANQPLYDAIEGLIAVETAQHRPREAAALRRWRSLLEGRQHESGIEHTT